MVDEYTNELFELCESTDAGCLSSSDGSLHIRPLGRKDENSAGAGRRLGLGDKHLYPVHCSSGDRTGDAGLSGAN